MSGTIGTVKAYGIVSLLLIQSCAQWFPAIAKEIEPGTYQLSAYGNSFTSRENLSKRVEKKAIKVCSPLGFQYITPAMYSFDHQEVYMEGRMQTVSAFQLQRMVSCKQ